MLCPGVSRVKCTHYLADSHYRWPCLSSDGVYRDEGKLDLEPYIREKGDSCQEKGYTSPLSSSPHFRFSRGGPPCKPLNTLGLHIRRLLDAGALDQYR